MHKLLSGHLLVLVPAQRPTPTTARPPLLPTWDSVAATVFSDGSSFNTCGTPTYDYSTTAMWTSSLKVIFLPGQKQHHTIHKPQSDPQSLSNSTPPHPTPTLPTTIHCCNSELWSQSLPSHMWSSPSPSTTKVSHQSTLNDTDPWSKSLPSHMLSSPSPSPPADSQPYVPSDPNHLKISNKTMNDTLHVSMFEVNVTESTNTDLKCPILYNHSQPDLVLPSLQKIPLSPILPPPISPTTKSNEILRNK